MVNSSKGSDLLLQNGSFFDFLQRKRAKQLLAHSCCLLDYN